MGLEEAVVDIFTERVQRHTTFALPFATGDLGTTQTTGTLDTNAFGTKLRETRSELLMLRLKKNTGQVEKPHMLRVLRKDIARLLTEQNVKLRATATR